MDPFTIGLLLAGTAASTGGGILSRNDATANAERQAAARNASLARNIGILDGFGAQNRTTFDTNMTNYDPATQAARLDNAQTQRSDGAIANVKQQDPNSIPLAGSAPAASRGELAKRMATTFDGLTQRAKATGKLGGYGDAWLQNNLGNAQSGRDIDVTNNYAAGRKSLIEPEGDLAAAQSYRAPSIWGPLLKGAGSIMSAAGGAGVGGFPGAAASGMGGWFTPGQSAASVKF